MSVAQSAAEVLRDHVVLEVEAIDRMYLNVYVPHLQSVGAVVGYLRVHRGQRFASTTAVTPMTEAFVRNIDEFVNDEGVDLVTFQKGQRKDDVTQKYVRKFTRREGVLYVGKAQEKARVMRTERRCSRFTGGTYPWIVESTAMVNHYYFYCVDEDFGPFFLKFCSYFPYNAKLCINGNEYLKRQLAKRGVAFEALDNGVKSCANPKLMQRLCDELSADKMLKTVPELSDTVDNRAHRGANDDRSVRTFAVKPRAFGAPLVGVGALAPAGAAKNSAAVPQMQICVARRHRHQRSSDNDRWVEYWFSADKIDRLLRKWLRRLPHPFPARDRAAGYRYQLSILQAEFSLTQVLDQPVTGASSSRR